MNGKELKAAIAALGCRQGVFAAHCGISPEALSRQINGPSRVNPLLVLLIREWQGPNPVNPPPARETKPETLPNPP